jgi:hypothetical protein
MTDVSHLHRAFEESGLSRNGWTFERAMQCEHTAWSIKHRADTLKPLKPIGREPKEWNGTRPAHMQRQYGDTVQCSCGRQFDVNDPDIENHITGEAYVTND